MPFNEETAHRIRTLTKSLEDNFSEKKMFGGLSFMYKGKMAIGVVGDKLAVRILREKYEEHLKRAFVSPMTFTGKSMKEFLYVESKAFQSESELSYWIDLGIEHAEFKLNS
ncbi:MAG: TfoX/Sxy family protein [Chitinophagales bacterium]|nr:TfoX/Sxy family protein [Chitinophagales bacterium]